MNKILFIILSCVYFLFVPNVNAASTTAYNQVFEVDARSHSSVTNKGINSIAFSGTIADSRTITRYAIDITNDLTPYEYISFFVYNENVTYYNIPEYGVNASMISPLVTLNRYACSVTPLGASNILDPNSNFYESAFFSVVCPVYSNTSGVQNLEMFALASDDNYTGYDSYWAFSVQYTGFIPDSSIADLEKSINDVNNSVNDLNSNITDTATDESSSTANSFFENFQDEDYGLSDIITIPLTLIKSLTNATCVSLKLEVPFVNKTMELPCMSSIYQKHFGSAYSLYQTVTFGFTAYWVIVRIFALVKGFKDPDNDKVEVVDL